MKIQRAVSLLLQAHCDVHSAKVDAYHREGGETNPTTYERGVMAT